MLKDGRVLDHKGLYLLGIDSLIFLWQAFEIGDQYGQCSVSGDESGSVMQTGSEEEEIKGMSHLKTLLH